MILIVDSLIENTHSNFSCMWKKFPRGYGYLTLSLLARDPRFFS